LRLLILSDTHGYLDPRIAALASEVELVVHAGDVGAVSVLDTLAGGGRQLLVVRGNNDTPEHWGRAGLEQLAAMPREARWSLPGGELVVVHGDRVQPAGRRHQRLRASFPQARLVVYGHSHRLSLDQEALPWVANPGAAGRARTYGGPSCLLLEAGGEAWRLEPLRFPLQRPGGRRGS